MRTLLGRVPLCFKGECNLLSISLGQFLDLYFLYIAHRVGCCNIQNVPALKPQSLYSCHA
jgi:hypothetical protein